LVKPDGTPFFYLADTAWELFHRLDRVKAEAYLTNRAAKGFTVIQAVVLAEVGGLNVPNPYGNLPLHDLDPAQPNEAYFEHVDFIVNKAAELGLVIGMLPTWGDKINKMWGSGPEIFTPDNANAFGTFLGKRYKHKPIIWILGGDRPAPQKSTRDLWRALAAGLHAGDGGRHLITFHSWAHNSSSDYIHEEPWVDFNMLQTSHVVTNNVVCYWQVYADYLRQPPKPTLNGEPCYEASPIANPIAGDVTKGCFDDFDIRQSTYWSLLAGGCGVTYGCHLIWQMLGEGSDRAHVDAKGWEQALDLPGSFQVGYARQLYESRAYTKLRTDQALIADWQGYMGEFKAVALADDGSFAFIYIPTGTRVGIAMEKICSQVRAQWFDPRTGAWTLIDAYPNTGLQSFTPPSSGRGNDWVLVLDAVLNTDKQHGMGTDIGRDPTVRPNPA